MRLRGCSMCVCTLLRTEIGTVCVCKCVCVRRREREIEREREREREKERCVRDMLAALVLITVRHNQISFTFMYCIPIT